MRIALAQINTTVGDFAGNEAKVLAAYRRARSQGVELVVAPELATTGYPPRDLLLRPEFIEANAKSLQRLAQATGSAGLLVGFVDRSPGQPGRGITNAAALCHEGRVIAVRTKSLLPTYDVFDEDRYFKSAETISVFEYKGVKLGISICEDFWNISSEYFHNRYQSDPLSKLAKMGAEVFINLSASPFEITKEKLRRELIHTHISRHHLPFILVNQVGGNDDLLFDGKSMLFDNKANLLYQANGFQEDSYTFAVNSLFESERATGEVSKPQKDVEAIHDALVMGIRDYFSKLNFQKAVIGLSGGIDSALVAALAAKALGPENVLGITMPSIYSSTGSYQDSEALALNLKIKIYNIKIHNIYDSYLEELKTHFQDLPMNIAEENIQARIRGNILMAFSNKFGHIVLSTGNKSELAMGYCTLYGDMSGGLAVISDVPKTMVYKLADFINKSQIIIPEEIIQKAPSAELRPEQKDQDSLPPYEILDEILNLYIEEHLSVQQIVARGFEKELATKIIKTVNRNEYKRKQLPIGLKVTGTAFGSGRRIPIAARFDDL